MSSILVLAIPALLTGLLVFTATRLRVTDRDLAWLAGGLVPADPEVAEVYRRYLRRHRVHRFVGGWFGVLLALVYGITASHGAYAGMGAAGPLGDLLFMGLAGVLVGALSAESYRLAQPRGTRAASLGGHPGLAFPGLVASARVLLALAVVGAITLTALSGGAQVAPWTLATPLVGAVLVGVGEATRAAIADRRRPVLSAAAAEVDGRIRSYASGAAARLELSAAALTAAWLVSPMSLLV
ncbi:MAG TPA: hypothetical protein PKB06_12925, partial [Actinotalea sp.]|nr:hypothetical protein [Actinotalea sp.]